MTIRQKISTLVFLFCAFPLFAQNKNTYEFNGFFNGENLKIQCRPAITKPWNICECLDSIVVNDKNYPDILYGGYQIDLANHADLNIHDSVNIKVFAKGCEMRFLNVGGFYPKNILPVKYSSISDQGDIQWEVQQNYPDLKLYVQIEQYKWGEWVRIGPLHTITDKKKYQANISEYLINGENKFRVVVASVEHVHVPAETMIIEHKGKKIKFKYKKKDKKIYFNLETNYEVWSEEWLLAGRGQGAEIDLKYYKPGIYILRYGGLEKKFEIK